MRDKHFPNIRIIPNKNHPQILDIELESFEEWKKYDSLEFHWVVYPYSREVAANHLEFHPFEEYVKDILDNQKSAYTRIQPSAPKRFGIFLGLVAALIVGYFHPEDFMSMEGIVSFFGAYIAGKELWADFDRYLVGFTRNFKLRYIEPYYSFRLEKNTTLAQYSAFAKKHRYEKKNITPEWMDYIEQSNSKTVRLKYESLNTIDNTPRESLHLLSLHIEPSKIEAMLKEGYLLGVKISLNKRKGFLMKNTELYQSLSKKENGALNLKGEWMPGMFAKRITFTGGRWKFFKDYGKMIEGKIIVFGEKE